MRYLLAEWLNSVIRIGSRRPLFVAVICFTAGIAAIQLYEGNMTAWAAAVVIFSILWIISNRLAGRKKCYNLLLFLCLFLGMIRGGFYGNKFRDTSSPGDGDVISTYGKIINAEERDDGEKLTVKSKEGSYLIYADEDKFLEGDYIAVTGAFLNFSPSTNPGAFDSAEYYSFRGVKGQIRPDILIIDNSKCDYVRRVLFKIRISMKDVIYKYFKNEDHAGFITAMLLGEKSGLNHEMRVLYQKNGIAHILAISGLHISLIGGAVEKLLKLIGVGKRKSSIAVMIIMLLYSIMTGFAFSTMRAVGMLIISRIGILIGRTQDTPTSMTEALLVIIILYPPAIFSSGLQMSFAATIGIYAGERLCKACFGKDRRLKLKGLRRDVRRRLKAVYAARSMIKTVISVLILNIFMLPLMLHYYYEIPLYSMLLNLLIVPTVGIAAGLGIIVMLLGAVSTLPWFTGIVSMLSMLCDGILSIYDKLCHFTLRLPMSLINTGHTEVWMVVIFYIILSLCIMMLSKIEKRIRRKLPLHRAERVSVQLMAGVRCMIPVIVMAVILCQGVYISNTYGERVVILDIGQGSAAIIHDAEGRNYIMDAGSTSKKNIGEYILIPALKYYGMSHISAAFLSHSDIDHINGLVEVLRLRGLYGLEIDTVCLAEGTEIDDNLSEMMAACRVSMEKNNRSDVPFTWLSRGDVADGSLYVIYPDYDGTSDIGALTMPRSGNDYSLVIRYESDTMSYLFTGDISREVEKGLIAEYGSGIEGGKECCMLDVDILICPHHGSGYSCSEEFLDAASPEIVIISCGLNNNYGHPAEETLERIRTEGSAIFRTDKDGAVIFYGR